MFSRTIIQVLKFSRLHTIIGTVVASITFFLIVTSRAPNIISSNYLVFFTFLAMAILLNLFVVGINQIYDLEIDKINKPNLPLPNGDFSVQTGWRIIIIAITIGFLIALTDLILMVTLLLIIFIGVLYSVPPIRLRNNFIFASLLIILGRGLILNVSAFYYFNTQINNTQSVDNEVWIILIFVSIFSLVISIYKDLPDVEGDTKFKIRTLVIVAKKPFTYLLNVVLLIFNYILILYFLIYTLKVEFQYLILGYHVFIVALLSTSLLYYSTILSNEKLIKIYYQLIWILLYIEYGIFALFVS